MARRIVKEHSGFPPDMITAGLFDDSDIMRAVLEAISETQRLDAELVKWSCMVPPDGGSPTDEEREAADSIAAAIMAGGHYR